MAKLEFNKLSGAEKAAILLMSVNEENATKVFSLLDDAEIRVLSQAMSSLGTINSEIIDRLVYDFTTQVSESVSFIGNLDNTERLLTKILGKDKVENILEDMRGPAGRNTWDKLGNVNEEVLAAYMRNEYPQTVALIVSKLEPQHAARVLAIMPEEFTFEVIQRVLDMDSVKKEVLDGIEKALRAEFISTITKAHKRDTNELMAEIFNNFDRTNESKFMGMLEQRYPEAAERIKNLMFTFEDLKKIDKAGIQIVLRTIDKSRLALALKGATEEVRDLFIGNMSARAAKILQEDMAAMGPVRLRDVDEAQGEIIAVVKELAAKGEVTISENQDAEDEMIY